MSEQTTGVDLQDVVDHAVSLAYLYVTAEVDLLIDLICDRFQNIVATDSRFPKLTSLEFELLIADARRDAQRLADQPADCDRVIEVIIDEVLAQLQSEQEAEEQG